MNPSESICKAASKNMNIPAQPIDFHPPAAEAAPFLLPAASPFAARAERFAALASSHSLGDWLDFLAALSRAQDAAYQALPVLAPPEATALARAVEHGMPPLLSHTLPADWQGVLQSLVTTLAPLAPTAAQAAMGRLQVSSPTALDALAGSLLNGEPDFSRAAELPYVAAALQVVFTRLASQLDAASLQAQDAHNVCPCCGSPAVAGIVRLGSTINNLRYLHCCLCNTEWNVPRAVCSSCGADKQVALHELDGQKTAVRGESCDDCHGYLKLVYQEKDPHVDPVADDLATLALDLLLDEAGYQRIGPNLLLIGAHGG